MQRLASLLLVLSGINAPGETLLSPDDPRISYAGFIRMEQAADSDSPTGKTVRFARILDIPGKGYRWNNPGTCIAFRTDADKIDVIFHFSDRHISTSARNSIGRYRIDGFDKPEWTFRTTQTGALRSPETVIVEIHSPSPGTFHNYECILPYGDSVEFQGLRLPADARLEDIPRAPQPRYIAYGDSITHGFTASETCRTYPFLLAERKSWELLNMGFAGRASTPSDAGVVALLEPDILTVLIGVNDWQAGRDPEVYRQHMEEFLSGVRAANPSLPVCVITPLWVPPAWNPEKVVAELEEYRRILRELVSSRGDPHLHLIEGPELIDHDPSLFDSVAVHPNDEGFAQMAERLDTTISDLPIGAIIARLPDDDASHSTTLDPANSSDL